MSSLIRSFLVEAAEEVTLPPQPTAVSPSVGAPMSHNDFVPPPPGAASPLAGGASMSIPSMPQGGPGVTTIQKEVMNKELVLAITGELKSVLNAFEKKFESEDMTVDVGSVYLKSFLDTLAFNAEKIAALMGVEDSGAEEPLPAAEPLPAEPPAAPEVPPISEPPLPTGEPEAGLEVPPVAPESQYTSPVEAPEASLYTSPDEAF